MLKAYKLLLFHFIILLKACSQRKVLQTSNYITAQYEKTVGILLMFHNIEKNKKTKSWMMNKHVANVVASTGLRKMKNMVTAITDRTSA